MVKRKIIKIDEDRCNGCGLCIPNCKEGALKIIDGKARLISDTFCDGLGACLGHCPQDAIHIIEREADEFDEEKVKEHMKKQEPLKCGCPGTMARELGKAEAKAQAKAEDGKRESKLSQWPVQLHLVSPMAPYFQKADILLAADCTAFAVGDFHKDFLAGKRLAIACPKLDEGTDIYIEKLVSLIDEAKINTLTVMIMEVPCCSGLAAIAQQALSKAKRKIPIKKIVISLKGEILTEDWI